MSVAEMFETYSSQDTMSCSSIHEDSDTGDGHLDCGGEHFDYPHSDHHTDDY